MANENYEKNGEIYLKCKECGKFKIVSKENWYKHNEGYLGVLGRCKECIKEGRKTEKELVMARKRDKKRYYNNHHRWIYCCWRGINERCEGRTNNGYYKKMGIKNIWIGFDQFYNDMYNNFVEHVKIYGIKNTTIDRIDGNGNYCKENCRWATYTEQANNTKSNKIVEYKGKLYTLANLCREYGKNYGLVHGRLYKGWTIEKALTIPVKNTKTTKK